ncbi:hypothetical protein DPMN_127233 [Dreissena polymorpha]|uniref:Uncharacterized protein n=1 Tax=Dreissena polymorpha TaxID=45954 RepID=A0A9D4H0W0_DREPO|nr:hypothetical protein DPMN_127233 [Dreissena polymorpha]
MSTAVESSSYGNPAGKKPAGVAQLWEHSSRVVQLRVFRWQKPAGVAQLWENSGRVVQLRKSRWQKQAGMEHHGIPPVTASRSFPAMRTPR